MSARQQTAENIKEDDTDLLVIDEYNKLNEKCDAVIEKIKKRKTKSSGK